MSDAIRAAAADLAAALRGRLADWTRDTDNRIDDFALGLLAPLLTGDRVEALAEAILRTVAEALARTEI